LEHTTFVIKIIFIDKISVITIVKVGIREEDSNFGKICKQGASEKLVFKYLVARVSLKQHLVNQTSTTTAETRYFLLDCLKVNVRELKRPDSELAERTKTFRFA
jgi:hypothetical protein